MITIQSEVHVERIGSMPIFNFLLNPTDSAYQRWWSGTHLQLHPLKQRPGYVGSVVYMDEYIGARRLRLTGIVLEADAGRKIIWQFRKVVRLPAWLILDLEEDETGVTITHTIKAGIEGIGSVLDVFLRLYLSDKFRDALDEHVRTEFPRLRDLLLAEKCGDHSQGSGKKCSTNLIARVNTIAHCGVSFRGKC